ncbi:Proton pump-interactor BIP103, partial [Mucuna pruriens]
MCGDYKSQRQTKYKRVHNVDVHLATKLKPLKLKLGEDLICEIVPQYIKPGKPSMNGVAEQRNQTLKDMLVWGEALSIAVYILNRVPTKRNAGILEEVEFGKEENIKNVVFEEESINDIEQDYDEVLPQTPIEELQQPQEVSLRRSIRERRMYLSDLGMQHWKAVKCVMCYLRRIKGYMLTYRKSKGLEIIRHKGAEKKSSMSISKLKKFYDEEFFLSKLRTTYEASAYINANWLKRKKDVAALDELSRSEVGNFMLEWNSNKAFREDYEKKVLQSLERRQLGRDGRRIETR